ncbi:relaxase domain-containing protein, partial [Azospirillum brasilense]|nr:relaxase domain-containing protein [Azospirillum brasilense]
MHEGRSGLSIGTRAGADYYVEAQAEYYLGGTEPTGVWGNTPGYFGYRDGSDVDPSAFKALHTGFNPRDGRALVQNAGAGKRRGGYDLTFRAGKGLSALWAVAPVAMRSAIEAAQEAAVRAALALVQERAIETRRGKDGMMRERVPAVGALVQHGDARSGDPGLHTHAVGLNVGERRDGTWGSLANEQLFRWKMAAGAVYRAELAAQLQERLGVAIDPHGERNEFIRVTGVPEALCEAWSKRRKDIEAAAAEKGFATGADAARAAGLTLATRGKKGHGEDRSARWVEEAAAMGWTAAAAMALQGTAQGDPVAARTAAWTGVAQRVREIIEHESVFTEPKLWQVTAEAAAGAFPARDIAGLVRRLEAEGVVVRLPGQTDAGQTVYSTRQAIEDEVAVRAMARQAVAAPALMVPSIVAKAAINTSDPPLTDEQGAASYHAMTHGGGVALVEGAPGVGKSTLLRPVVQGYRWAGAQAILATAVAWRQARDLGDGVGADAALAAEALRQRGAARGLGIRSGRGVGAAGRGQRCAPENRHRLDMNGATGAGGSG